MKKHSTTLLTIVLMMLNVSNMKAQFCSPSFASGCFSWRTQSVNVEAINWTVGTCTDNDFTTDTAFLGASLPYAMTITNGDWCGAGVWVDLNNDLSFDASENLFYSYQANATNSYSFNLVIPAGTPTGNYRMRVISGWGTDCFNTSANGYGPCGSYQYGNFVDFTASVDGSTGIQQIGNALPILSASPNPFNDIVKVTLSKTPSENATIQIGDVIGRVVYKSGISSTSAIINLADLNRGFYFLTYEDGPIKHTLRLKK